MSFLDGEDFLEYPTCGPVAADERPTALVANAFRVSAIIESFVTAIHYAVLVILNQPLSAESAVAFVVTASASRSVTR